MNAMTFRNALAALLLALAPPALATDYSDLWWSPSESGSGVTVTHQGNVVFIALFVYGQDGKATWFSSPATFVQSDSNGNPVYTGTLFQSTGPAFAGAFNPANAHATAVGTATFAVTSATTANLGYTVGSVTVGKSLERQTFKLNGDVAGQYLAGLAALEFSCPNTPPMFPPETSIFFSIAGPPGQTNVLLGDETGCSATGTYSQSGRLGRIEGTLACLDGRTGTASFREIEANRSGVRALYTLNVTNGCRESGRLAATRRLGSQ
jgi:hypothetical protein